MTGSDPCASQEETAKGLNHQPRTITLNVCTITASLLQELGIRGKRRKTALCTLTLSLFVGRGSTAPLQGYQDLV